MPDVDIRSLAKELAAAYAGGGQIAVLPSARYANFDLRTAYDVEAELCRLRRDAGHPPVGRKVGFANKALWRVLKLDTLVWAHMYDDTVQYAPANRASFSIAGRWAPKIEPEIVLNVAGPLPEGSDPAAVLESVEWIALGFEINDCVFPGWQFKPADFVAAFGFHIALVVGEPLPVQPSNIPSLVEQLAGFTLRLSRDGQLVEKGSGKASLRSPALCLAELSAVIARQPGADPLAIGEIVSSGTLTAPHPLTAGEEWSAEVDGLDLPGLTLRVE